MSFRRALAFATIFVGGCASLLGLDEPEFLTDVGLPPDGDATIANDGPLDATVDGSAVKDGVADTTFQPIAGLIDDFNRPSASAIGNGWIEKTAGVFDLVNNGAELVNGDVVYSDSLVYRPPGEEYVDVTVGVTLSFDTTVGTPFIVARLTQPTPASSFIGYFARCPDATRLQINRQNGTGVLQLAEITLQAQLVPKTSYRLTLSVVNAPGAVTTFAQVRTLDGTILGQVSNNDQTPLRITTAGLVGFGGTNTLGAHTRFDDYSRTSP